MISGTKHNSDAVLRFICFLMIVGGILSGQFYGYFARDMQRPDIMWILFGVLGGITVLALVLYNKFIIQKTEN